MSENIMYPNKREVSGWDGLAQSRTSVVLAALLALLLAGCSRVVLENNFTLRSGETVNGNLVIPSGNVDLEEGSQVTGSVLVGCCNVIADGEVGGDVVLVSGNLTVGEDAVITGDVLLGSGNLDNTHGGEIRGEGSFPVRSWLTLALACGLCLLPLALLVLAGGILLSRRGRRKEALTQSIALRR
jgi:predicted acyltransferase (DUF342 family)